MHLNGQLSIRARLYSKGSVLAVLALCSFTWAQPNLKTSLRTVQGALHDVAHVTVLVSCQKRAANLTMQHARCWLTQHNPHVCSCKHMYAEAHSTVQLVVHALEEIAVSHQLLHHILANNSSEESICKR